MRRLHSMATGDRALATGVQSISIQDRKTNSNLRMLAVDGLTGRTGGEGAG